MRLGRCRWGGRARGSSTETCSSLSSTFIAIPWRRYTLHPIPYTLHPTPYTLHPTPYTLSKHSHYQAAPLSNHSQCEINESSPRNIGKKSRPPIETPFISNKNESRLLVDETHPTTLHLTPYTLHPAPCTLHPTPYTLHPMTYAHHPTPYTLHPTPYTLHPTPFTLHPTPYTLKPTPYTLHPTPYTLH
jgi:hypothetical protein